MAPKLSQNQMSVLKETKKMKVDPETIVEPYPNPKNSPLGPQKVKNDPNIKSKSNVRIEIVQLHE